MDLTPEEINSLAVMLACIIAKNSTKKEILSFKFFLSQVLCNLNTYLFD